MAYKQNREQLSDYLQKTLSGIKDVKITEFVDHTVQDLQTTRATAKQVQTIMKILFSYITSFSALSEFEKIKGYLLSDRVRKLVQMLVVHTYGRTTALMGVAECAYPFHTALKTKSILFPKNSVITERGQDSEDFSVQIVSEDVYHSGFYNATFRRELQHVQASSFNDLSVHTNLRSPLPGARGIKPEVPTARVEPLVQSPEGPNKPSTMTPKDMSAACATILLRWFTDDHGRCIITQPGTLRLILEILSKWFGDRKVEVNLEFDSQLLTMVQDLISKEKKDTLNKAGHGTFTVLTYAAVRLQSPELTKELLEHPDIDINVQDNGQSTLHILIAHVNSVYNTEELRNMCTIVNLFLKHPTIDPNTLAKCYTGLVQFIDKAYGLLPYKALGSQEYNTSIDNDEVRILILLSLLHDIATHSSMDKSKMAEIIPLFIKIGGRKSILSTHYQNKMACDLISKYQAMFINLLPECQIDNVTSLLTTELNVPLFDALLNYPNFDPNCKDSQGNTCLHNLVQGFISRHHESQQPYRPDENIMSMLVSLLQHPNIDTTIENSHGKTSLMILCNSQRLKSDQTQLLRLVNLLVSHPTATGEMVHVGLTFLTKIARKDDQSYMHMCHRSFPIITPGMYDLSLPRSNNHQSVGSSTDEQSPLNQSSELFKQMYLELVSSLCGHSKMDINQRNAQGLTMAHLAAANQNAEVLEIIITTDHYDPSVKDRQGNTVLFYIFQNFSVDKVAELVNKCAWDFSCRNDIGETISDYCENVEPVAPKKRLMCLCKKLMPQLKPDSAFTSPLPLLAPAERVPRPVSLIQLHSDGRQASVVNTSEQGFVNDIYNNRQKQEVYEMKGARKGKALIISNHTFDVPWLARLEGYTYDKEQLRVLWDHIGFDVYYPKCEDDSVFTAQEMESAVDKFSKELNETDDCAVLCVLSHGGDGFVYGSDGKQVKIAALQKYLDNNHCPVMVDKPKVIIVQACNGKKQSSGVCQTAGPGLAEAAAGPNLNPDISDMVTCSPSMPGYVSYVYKTPGEGSVFIKTLVEVIQEHASTEDIYALHTRVNAKIKSEAIQVENADGSVGWYKQMSRFESSLCRHLYFLPCPGGKHGNDWQ